MADGAKFDISIEAQNLGVDASAAQLNALVGKLQQVDVVATKFDAVVAAASKRLEEASAAAKMASDAHVIAAKRYDELERAADSAAKKVEKAAAAGKDTTALKAAAESAAAAMRDQAKAVEELAIKSKSAASAQATLAGALKALQGQQAAAAAETKKAAAAAQAAAGVTYKTAEASKVAEKASDDASKGASKYAAASNVAKLAAFGMAAATIAAVAGLAHFAVASNPAAMQKMLLISQRLQLSFQQLFRGIKLDGFLTSIHKFAALFEQTNSSGKALKLLVETIFQPIFDAVTKLEPYAAEAFKGLIYGALKVAIAVLSIRNAIFKSMSPETRAEIKNVVDKIFTLENAFKVGEVAAGVLAVALGYVAISMLGVVINAALMVAPFVLIGIAIYELIDNWQDVSDWIESWWDSFIDHPADAVAAMLQGIVDGIVDGAKWVYDAMSNLADGAVDAFKSTLGIQSPSKVFRLQGHYTTAGYVEGVEEGAPAVRNALESMASPGDLDFGGAPPVTGGSSTTTSTSSARAVHIEHLSIGEGPVSQATWGAFKHFLVEELEGASLTIGGGEAPAT